MSISIKALVLSAGAVSGTSLTAVLIEMFPQYTPLAAIAGLMGGASRWIGKRQKWWPDGLGSLIAGVMCAVSLWPLGQWYIGGKIAEMQMDPRTAVLFGGFVTGVSAVSIIGMLIDTAEMRRRRLRRGEDD